MAYAIQPILSFLAETPEYIWGELRNGDRRTENKLRGIWPQSSPPYPLASRRFLAGRIPVSIVGTRTKPMRKAKRSSLS